VIPLESPASWPLEALKAQAVAARTYALTTSKGGAGFDHYADTRSQVYGGAGAEQPSTNEAADATAGQLVTYGGEPVPTYFFSTSGGRTEDVENTTLGDAPKPWLKSVVDKYDSVSPKHRWGPIRMRYRTAGRKLRGLVKGRFKGIKVVQRGSSPRIVAADVIGSRGRTRVDGATIRARLGLFDSWVYFSRVKKRPAAPAPDLNPDTGGVKPDP
jgi:stage II sporulation protein D